MKKILKDLRDVVLVLGFLAAFTFVISYPILSSKSDDEPEISGEIMQNLAAGRFTLPLELPDNATNVRMTDDVRVYDNSAMTSPMFNIKIDYTSFPEVSIDFDYTAGREVLFVEIPPYLVEKEIPAVTIAVDDPEGAIIRLEGSDCKIAKFELSDTVLGGKRTLTVIFEPVAGRIYPSEITLCLGESEYDATTQVSFDNKTYDCKQVFARFSVPMDAAEHMEKAVMTVTGIGEIYDGFVTRYYTSGANEMSR